jgi:hypothetical protein
MVYFKPKIPILVNIGGVFQCKMLVYFMTFGLFYGYSCTLIIWNYIDHLVFAFCGIFFPFWYDEPRKIWQPWRRRWLTCRTTPGHIFQLSGKKNRRKCVFLLSAWKFMGLLLVPERSRFSLKHKFKFISQRNTTQTYNWMILVPDSNEIKKKFFRKKSVGRFSHPRTFTS